ncbi:MAG: hypothetical protein HKN05_22185 [Rhizobiales bacterium]|nr:hypothetical protein [Hyphomicrobiales bacterium]
MQRSNPLAQVTIFFRASPRRAKNCQLKHAIVLKLIVDPLLLQGPLVHHFSLCLISFTVAGSALASSFHFARAYTPDNHELYMVRGAQMCKRVHGVKLGKRTLKEMIEGVREPDKISPTAAQMLKQRFERNSYGKQRAVSPKRVAAQAIHGSPNPTRPMYRNSAPDQAKLKKTIRLSADKLMRNRFPMDVFSYDTNQAVRNKILINASQFLCVSFAHKSDRQSARKFGNMMHMLGDTYSASHVQRSAPKGSPAKCGTEKIEWHYSMDLIAWKLHVRADKQTKDWRFGCIVEHSADLMSLWASGRAAVRKEAGKAAKLKRANQKVKQTLAHLCKRVLREDREVLNRPAGGAAAGYSITSGTDNWKFYKKKKPDTAIQPVGLTGPGEARDFVKATNAHLKRKRSKIEFWYPSRAMKDLCQGVLKADRLPAPLRCTPQEIDWAMQASKKVRTMWLPTRKHPLINAGN